MWHNLEGRGVDGPILCWAHLIPIRPLQSVACTYCNEFDDEPLFEAGTHRADAAARGICSAILARP